jgi:ribosome biogenesis protein MAK21
MKKNKEKSSTAANDPSVGVDIAPSALANLADRLKVDLAKPAGQVKENKKGQKNEKKLSSQPQQNKGNKEKFNSKPTPAKGFPKDQKDKKTQNGGKVQRKVEGKEKPKQNGQTATSTSRPEKAKPERKQEKSKSGSDKKKDKKAKPEKPTESSLLDEIIALGGTADDLELVEDVDSEEEIIGDSGNKSGGDKSVWIQHVISNGSSKRNSKTSSKLLG